MVWNVRGLNRSVRRRDVKSHIQKLSPLLPVQEMVTPLGIVIGTFSTDEQVVVQGDVTFMGKTVKLLVVEIDQAKYEKFLSSGSKSPRVA